jgi:hypothetical protein
MEELDILKQDWKKQESKFPKLSFNEIYKMILKKSSSIVKWIFIISLLEFAFWTLISFALKDSPSMQRFESYGADALMIPVMIIGYVILAYFFYRFYMNYRTISVTDNAKKLMENILRTRRTVRYYVLFNLGYLFLSSFVSLGVMFNKDKEFIDIIDKAAANGEVFKVYAVTILVALVFLAIVVALILGFYYLIYGLLLKSLNRNYIELKKLEV